MSEPAAGRVVFDKRCWNHDAREAVCRCPACGRSFCRECVTEHENRLMCASCLQNAVRTAAHPVGGLRWVVRVGITAAGVILAWAIFFGAAESLITITERAEHVEWQKR